MNSTQSKKWSPWNSQKKKPFPQSDDGGSPEQPDLLLVASPRSGGRLKRMLSNSKLSKHFNSPPSAISHEPEPETRPRQRYNSISRSLFSRNKPDLIPPSPPLSEASSPDLCPDLSPSTSSSSSSSFVSAVSQPQYQRLELLPQITLDANEPWSLQPPIASKEPGLEPALPIKEAVNYQRQPGKESPSKQRGREGANKSVWEISSESEGEADSEALHFQKRVTKNKPTLTTLQIPETAESKRSLSHDRSKRMSSSTASITSSPPASPSPLCGSRALYNHTCAKLRESAVPFAIETMPSSTAKVAEGKIPKKLSISLQRQALLRKLGSPFAPGANLNASQQKEIAYFMPRGRAQTGMTSPIIKPLLEFDTPAPVDNEALMSTGLEGKSVAELKSSPLLIWIERPTFARRMVEYTPSAEVIPIDTARSTPFKYTHIIQSQIALHREHAAQARRMQEKRRSNRLSRLQNLSSSPQEYSGESLPFRGRPPALGRRAQSTPAAPLSKISNSEEEDELPLARLISPKSSTSPVKKVKVDSARDQKRLSATLPPTIRSQSLPKVKLASSLAWTEVDSKREYDKLQMEKANRRRSALLQSPVTPTESTNKRNSLAYPSIPEGRVQEQGRASMPEQGRDRRKSMNATGADAREKRRSQLLTSPPSSWSSPNLPGLAEARPRPVQTVSDPTKRRSQGDTRRHSALPAQPFFTEVVLPLQGQQHNTNSFPWLPAAPAQTYQYTQPMPRTQSFQSHSVSHRHSVNLSTLGNTPVSNPLSRSWSSPNVHRV